MTDTRNSDGENVYLVNVFKIPKNSPENNICLTEVL